MGNIFHEATRGLHFFPRMWYNQDMVRLFLAGIILFSFGLILPASAFSQNQAGGFPVTIPELLLRPLRGEAPRYPKDMVIGELGQGTAPERAWRYARGIAAVLVAGNQSSSVIAEEDGDILKEHFTVMRSFEPRKYNLGGGRTEVDGTVSFLVRFIGREQWMAGEIYLRPDEGNWRLDELFLEEVRGFEEGKRSYSYDFSPYERFF